MKINLLKLLKETILGGFQDSTTILSAVQKQKKEL